MTTNIPSSPKPALPPIPDPSPLYPLPSTHHPAIVYRANGNENPALRPDRDMAKYLAHVLNTPKLDIIHRYLWLAGLPSAARPLHRQKLLKREICITENPNEHLVWFESRIFIKPLPIFLLDSNFWKAHLSSDQELRSSACGLLLSYTWIVSYESDLAIAKEVGLLPDHIEWSRWTEFISKFLDNIPNLDHVGKRYKYGELRLSRLNTIYRVVPEVFCINHLVRGYMPTSTWYNAFFERHFRWILSIFAILSVSLSAFQVGLGTSFLQTEDNFQRVSYHFTVFSLVAVAVGGGLVAAVWSTLFWFHLLTTWSYNKKVEHRRVTGM